MSQKERTDPIGDLEASESPIGDLSKLTELARQAYEGKNTKDCLDLTRSILLIDPDNAEAQWMRSSIQSDMHRDLRNSRAFLRQANSKDDLEKPSRQDEAVVSPDPKPDSDGEELEPSVLAETVESAAAPDHSRLTSETRWFLGATILIVVGALVASLAATMPRFRTRSNPVQASLLPVSPAEIPKPNVKVDAVQPAPSVPKPSTEVALVSSNSAASLPSSPGTTGAVTARIPDLPPAKRPATNPPDPPVIVVASGTLAVNSPTSVDIYKDDVYLGSVPLSIELSAGTHTFEYRHGSLIKNVTHVINSSETTKAMITFEVSVQINAKPWADVFIDGVEKKALGQTPLSRVRVPIGSVLIFENPQFQPKKYRVTGNETGIQVVFP